MHVVKLSGPADPVPTVEDLRKHCRIYGTSEDDYLVQLRDTATATVEAETGHGVGVSQYEVTLPIVGRRSVELPRYPLDPDALMSVEVGDEAIDYTVDYGDTTYPVVSFEAPKTGLLTVTFSAGSANPLAIGAVRLLVGHLYEHREAVSGETVNVVPMALTRLYALLRIGGAW
jgi:hypothetical protein